MILSLAVILIWSVEGSGRDADAYVQTLDETGFFETPYQLIRDGDIPGIGGLLLGQGPLSVAFGTELEAIARELAPPDWLRAQTARAIRDLIAAAEGPELNDVPSLVISLREVKVRALGEPGDRSLSIVVEVLPVCPAGRAALKLNSDTPVCIPADVDLAAFVLKLKGLLIPLVWRLPDTYRISWQPEARDVVERLLQVIRVVDRLQSTLLLFIALNLALLGLIWLLAVRSPAEWMRWTGGPLLLLGLLTLLIATSVPRVVSWGLDNQTFWADKSLPVTLAQALEEAIKDFSLLLFRPARSAGWALIAVGLLLTLVSPLCPGRRKSVSSVS